MKTYIQFKEEVAKDHGYLNWDVLCYDRDRMIPVDHCETEAAKRYATAAIKEHLSRAAENARTRTNDESTSIIVDRESITNIDIELK